MSVTSVRKDTEQLSMTVTAEYDVTADRAWRLWADPRQLGAGGARRPTRRRWRSMTSHPEGVSYYMTGPEGDQPRGSWNVLEVEPPRLLVVEDGFADETGAQERGHADHGHAGRDHRPTRGRHHDHRVAFPVARGHGPAPRHGHGGGLQEALGQIDAILEDTPAPTSR